MGDEKGSDFVTPDVEGIDGANAVVQDAEHGKGPILQRPCHKMPERLSCVSSQWRNMRLGTDTTVPEASMVGTDVPNLLDGREPRVEDGRCNAESVGEGLALGLRQVVTVIGDQCPEGDNLDHHP